MPRQDVDVHHRAVGEIVDLVQTGDPGHRARPPTLMKIRSARRISAADLDLAGREEARVTLADGDVLVVSQRPLDRLAGETGHVVFPRLDALHVDQDLAAPLPIVKP